MARGTSPKLVSSKPKSVPSEPASDTEKNVMLLTLGLLILVLFFFAAVFDVLPLREGATPPFVAGTGVIGCVICCLMSGHLTPAKLGALGEFLKIAAPRGGAAS